MGSLEENYVPSDRSQDMADSTAPGEFDDVNDVVGSEWKAETTPHERVREIISRVYTPVSADSVAETARTSPKTARNHLNTLAEDGFVATETGENGAMTYRRSPESLVVEQAVEIREHVSMDEFVDRVVELREHISDFQAEFGVGSPEELLVEQTNATLAEAATDHDDIDPELLQEWRTTRRNLAFANVALAIANAEQVVNDNLQRPDGSVPGQGR